MLFSVFSLTLASRSNQKFSVIYFNFKSKLAGCAVRCATFFFLFLGLPFGATAHTHTSPKN